MDSDLIWAAGLFDGEGCITLSHRTPAGRPRYWSLQASLAGTHEETIRRFAEIVQVGKVYERPARSTRHKVTFVWVVFGPSAEVALDAIRPWLFTKRHQADLAASAREVQASRVTRSYTAADTAKLEEIRAAIQAANGNQKAGR